MPFGAVWAFSTELFLCGVIESVLIAMPKIKVRNISARSISNYFAAACWVDRESIMTAHDLSG